MSKAIAPQINTVQLGGNLTKDPVVVNVQTGDSTSNDKLTIIRVASNRQFKTEEGYKQETSFIDVSVWGKLGEMAVKRLKKGSAVLIEGRLSDSKYKPNQNEEKTISIIRVKATKIHFLEKGESYSDDEFNNEPDTY